VIAFESEAVLWEGTAEDATTYDGPDLGEGLHVVSIGGREFPFFTVSPSERQDTRAALASVRSEGLTPLESVALQASLLLQAGYPSDALGVVDQGAQEHPGEPGWAQLVTQFEKRAGL
jgi:hypothetical protein